LTPVIFISGLAESPGISYGAKPVMGFLGKPFNFNQLKHKVKDVMERAYGSSSAYRLDVPACHRVAVIHADFRHQFA